MWSPEPVTFPFSQWHVHQDIIEGAVLYSCTFLLGLCGAKSLLKNQRTWSAVHGSVCRHTGFTHTTDISCWNKKSLKKDKPHTAQAIVLHVRTLQTSHKTKERFSVFVFKWLRARCCRCTRQEGKKGQQLVLLSLDCKQWLPRLLVLTGILRTVGGEGMLVSIHSLSRNNCSNTGL